MDQKITLEDVKNLPLHEVYDYALRHLVRLQKKRAWNQIPKVRRRNQENYYLKQDIYHPDINPEGKIEKHAKRIFYARRRHSPSSTTSLTLPST